MLYIGKVGVMVDRLLVGGLGALALAGVGFFWWQGRAEIEKAAPPPNAALLAQDKAKGEIPVSDPGDLRGPALPKVSELSREQKRFFRYDLNRDQKVSRTEMLSTRTAGFRKLDKDGNNLLTFEEWAVTTVEKFDGADKDRNRELSPAEFATTAPKKSAAKNPCHC